MNPYAGQPSTKRDFEMAMGFDGGASFMQGTGGMKPQGPGGMGQPSQMGSNMGAQMGSQQGGFMSMYGQMGMPYNQPPNQQSLPGQLSGGVPPQMMGFDPLQMPFMGGAPRFFPPVGSSAPLTEQGAKDTAPKSNADWALEKRRARNRITAAESRRKCKEEIQNLRDELLRLKEEKQEKEDLIEYYRNRYEKFEVAGAAAPVASEIKSEVPNAEPVKAPDAAIPSTVQPVTTPMQLPSNESTAAPRDTIVSEDSVGSDLSED